ncbi:MAG: single-stranded-DNA-specific exonuclease RecJ [Planctomycetota bacterium]
MAPDSPATPTWRLTTPDAAQVRGLATGLGVSPLVATLLANRGFAGPAQARPHLNPDLSQLTDPMLLPDMPAACKRLMVAIERGHTILVHGDYDVDGVTGTALLVRLLRHLGADVHWHIPSRFDDGYAFGDHSLRKAAEVGAQLVVSVDNGTSSADVIASLSGMGIDTIVTDHHEPPADGVLPQALAIVNPKREDCTYPFRELCGAAVAFKLAWGLCQEITGERQVRPDLRDFLVDAMGLVAIATVCDVVPLEQENRVLAHFGLKSLGAARLPGFRALLEVADLKGRPLTAEDVAFQIGPRINAAGRLDTAARAVEVLLAEDDVAARLAAGRLDQFNKQRRELERALLDQALAQARPFGEDPECPVIVIGDQGWHQGLVGIIAARLVDRFHKPAIVIGFDGETGRGSARSVTGVSILDCMHGASEYFDRYGGHEAAAGCELIPEHLEAVRHAVCDRAKRVLAENPPPEAQLQIDFDLPFEHMGEETMRSLERLEPFGTGNEQPVLLSQDLRLAEPPRRVGGEGEHLMLQLRRGNTVLRAMFFGQGRRAEELAMGLPLHAVYTPRRNHFRGQSSLQLLLKDLHVGPTPPLAP